MQGKVCRVLEIFRPLLVWLVSVCASYFLRNGKNSEAGYLPKNPRAQPTTTEARVLAAVTHIAFLVARIDLSARRRSHSFSARMCAPDPIALRLCQCASSSSDIGASSRMLASMLVSANPWRKLFSSISRSLAICLARDRKTRGFVVALLVFASIAGLENR